MRNRASKEHNAGDITDGQMQFYVVYAAVGFALVIDGCMSFSHDPVLTYGSPVLLRVVNGYAAYHRAAVAEAKAGRKAANSPRLKTAGLPGGTQ